MHVDSTSAEYFHSPYNHCELRARIPFCCVLATPKGPSNSLLKEKHRIRLRNRLRYQSSPCEYICITSACSFKWDGLMMTAWKVETCNQLRPSAINKNYNTRCVRRLFSTDSLEETLSIRTKPSSKIQISISHLPHYSCVTVWEEKVSLVDPLGGLQLTPLAHQTATPSWACCASWENSSTSLPLTTIFSVADHSLLIFFADYTQKDRFTRGRQANPC